MISRPPMWSMPVTVGMNSIMPVRFTSEPLLLEQDAGPIPSRARCARPRARRMACRASSSVRPWSARAELMERAVARVGGAARGRDGGRLAGARSPPARAGRARASSTKTRSCASSSGMNFTGDADDDELPAVDAALVEVAQPAADLGRVADRLVEVLEEEERRTVEVDDEIERRARAERLAVPVRCRRAACPR